MLVLKEASIFKAAGGASPREHGQFYTSKHPAKLSTDLWHTRKVFKYLWSYRYEIPLMENKR